MIQCPEPWEVIQGGGFLLFRRERGILYSWRLGGHFLGETDHTFTCGAGTAHLGWLCPHLVQQVAPRVPGLTLLMGRAVTHLCCVSRHMGAWPGDGGAHLWGVRSSAQGDASPRGTEGHSQQQLLWLAGFAWEPGWSPWLCEALAGALVEEQGGSSLGSYLCGLCKITGSGQHSFG